MVINLDGLAPYVYQGDCSELLALMPDSSVDAVITDPPAGISFMGKEWDKDRGSRRQWIEWMTSVMRECLRVLKPGHRALVWALPRTSHWTGTALEEAGFRVLDSLHHVFGSGFPKSRSLLKPAHEVWWLVQKPGPAENLNIDACRVGTGGDKGIWPITDREGRVTMNSAEDGSFNNPQETDNTVGRWPPNFLLTHAADCVPEGVSLIKGAGWTDQDVSHEMGYGGGTPGAGKHYTNAAGLEEVEVWKCSSSCPVAAMNAQSGIRKAGGYPPEGGRRTHISTYGKPSALGKAAFGSSEGAASRFFPRFTWEPEDDYIPFLYQAKANRKEREAGCENLPKRTAGVHDDDAYVWPCNGDGTPRNKKVQPRANHHPTVKNIQLMSWLVRLISQPDGLILDPFCGSGSTGLACIREHRKFIGFEKDVDYVNIAQARIQHALQKSASIGPVINP